MILVQIITGKIILHHRLQVFNAITSSVFLRVLDYLVVIHS